MKRLAWIMGCGLLVLTLSGVHAQTITPPLGPNMATNPDHYFLHAPARQGVPEGLRRMRHVLEQRGATINTDEHQPVIDARFGPAFDLDTRFVSVAPDGTNGLRLMCFMIHGEAGSAERFCRELLQAYER